MTDAGSQARIDLQRRRILSGAFAAVAGAPLTTEAGQAQDGDMVPTRGDEYSADGGAVRLLVNGQHYELAIDNRVTLLDALRDHLGLTGTKKGCDHGQCGSCTISVDGQAVLGCLSLAVACSGRAIKTIEGLSAEAGELSALQKAFVDHDAFQCGYCTSGQIMSASACIDTGNARSADSVREFMSGNLCRCAAYPNIVAAVLDAAKAERS